MDSAKQEVKPTREQLRANRVARREKQRSENVDRASKMHKARLEWERNRGALGFVTEEPIIPEFNVGCSGWFYWDWRGKFYPEDLPTSRWFPHYARRFDTVELNAPFYSWPTVGIIRGWIRQAGKRPFVFTVKASELITHVKQFSDTKTLIRDFGYIADLVGPRMGCFLFQLPPSFHYSRARLDRVLSQLDPARRNVVEFRHGSWWNEHVYTAFRANGVIFCSCIGPKLPDELITIAKDWDGFAIKNARVFLRQLQSVVTKPPSLQIGLSTRNDSRANGYLA